MLSPPSCTHLKKAIDLVRYSPPEELGPAVAPGVVERRQGQEVRHGKPETPLMQRFVLLAVVVIRAREERGVQMAGREIPYPPPFPSAVTHALDGTVSTFSGVWIDWVRLPILLVVS